MKTITAGEFETEVTKNPAWASTLTEPVEVVGYCDMKNSGISHLSPLLHFTGQNDQGDSASFHGCKHLKVAEGNFAGYVFFDSAGITKIGEINITQTDDLGNAVTFAYCKDLLVAEGTFPGTVYFDNSGIRKIGNLTVANPNKTGHKACFDGCNLRLPKEFLGPEYRMDKDTRQKNLLGIAASKVQRATPDLEI